MCARRVGEEGGDLFFVPYRLNHDECSSEVFRREMKFCLFAVALHPAGVSPMKKLP